MKKSRFWKFLTVQWNLIGGILAGVVLALMYSAGWWIPLSILLTIALVLLAVSMYRFNKQSAIAYEKARAQLAEIEARKESYVVSE